MIENKKMDGRLNPKLTKRAQACAMYSTFKDKSVGSHSSGEQSEDGQETVRSGYTDETSASGSTSGASSSESYSPPSINNKSGNATNPRLHLLHNGKWIPKEYVVGRWKPGTGLWDCCGEPEHLSMYCESLEAREQYRQKVERTAATAKEENDFRYARKDAMQKHVQWSKEHEVPDPKLKKTQVVPSYEIYSSIAEAESQEKINLATSAAHSYNAPMLVSWLLRHCQEEETVIQGLNQAYKHLQTPEGCSLLARHDLHNTIYRIATHFMSWQPDIVHLCLQCLRQLVDCNETREMVLNPSIFTEDNTQAPSNGIINDGATISTAMLSSLHAGAGNGLGSVAEQSTRSYLTPPHPHLDSPALRCTMLVCEILMRYGRLSAEQVVLQYQFSQRFPPPKENQFGIMTEEIVDEAVEEQRKKEEETVRSYLYQGKKPMTMTPADLTSSVLEHCIRCLMQASRYETHRQALWDLHLYQYTKSFVMTCYKESGPDLIHGYLRFLHWSATTPARLTFFHERIHILMITLKCLKAYSTEAKVLVPAITLLHWLISQLPNAFQAALDLSVIEMVVKSLRYVHDDEITQLTALKLIQLLAKSSQGFKQLDSIRGAWQTLTQGTIIAEELVHQLPGPLQNKGWSIGDAPFRPLREIQAEQSRVLAQNALQQAPKSSWTPVSLRQYMGLSMSGQKLAINTEQSVVFFELLTTLDMLPNAGEIKEDWFKRLRQYEQESELSIQEMVETVEEMRRREKIRFQMQKQGLAVGQEGMQLASLGAFSAKELYVQGKAVTAETLQQNDADIVDAMNGEI